jgi:poly-gamma-glutamate synthesis protein (capsule biosynthesis protein)
LDWQRPGLSETLQVLDEHNIEHAGAGKDILAAVSPTEFNLHQGKRWVFAYGMESSGVYES